MRRQCKSRSIYPKRRIENDRVCCRDFRRSIATFDAANDVEAKGHLANQAFLRDLIVTQNQGRPLWDGVSPIQMRRASTEEAETWQAGHTPEDAFVFLVPVVDPSSYGYDDDDDDDDDGNDDDRD